MSLPGHTTVAHPFHQIGTAQSARSTPGLPRSASLAGPVLVELFARRSDCPMNRIRNVTFQIKPGKTAEFTKVLNADVLPIMRKQPGFKHELAMVNGSYGVGLSVWQDSASAEKYEATGYPDVLKKLSPLIDGEPRVTNFELAATTLTV